jgi:hypothetical protein
MKSFDMIPWGFESDSGGLSERLPGLFNSFDHGTLERFLTGSMLLLKQKKFALHEWKLIDTK